MNAQVNQITYSQESFAANVQQAEQAATTGPVFITAGDERTHVLLSNDEYQLLVRVLMDTLKKPAKAIAEKRFNVVPLWS